MYLKKQQVRLTRRYLPNYTAPYLKKTVLMYFHPVAQWDIPEKALAQVTSRNSMAVTKSSSSGYSR
jgi:hypothetical protein